MVEQPVVRLVSAMQLLGERPSRRGRWQPRGAKWRPDGRSPGLRATSLVRGREALVVAAPGACTDRRERGPDDLAVRRPRRGGLMPRSQLTSPRGAEWRRDRCCLPRRATSPVHGREPPREPGGLGELGSDATGRRNGARGRPWAGKPDPARREGALEPLAPLVVQDVCTPRTTRCRRPEHRESSTRSSVCSARRPSTIAPSRVDVEMPYNTVPTNDVRAT